MSRIGKLPIPFVDGVKVAVNARVVTAEGPKGKLTVKASPSVKVEVDDAAREVRVVALNETRQTRALHGLTRALVANMMTGVKEGYEKKLELQGVGYVCNLQGKILSLRVGFANELKREVPVGLDVTVPDQTHIVIKGCDKQLVGQFAAEIRSLRKPEPYKGKGIRYVGETVKLKPGKSAT